MTRHVHDGGQLIRRPVTYDYVEHYDDADPGLLVVDQVPADICVACDQFWFDEETGFVLARLIEQHRPAPGSVRTIAWLDHDAA